MVISTENMYLRIRVVYSLVLSADTKTKVVQPRWLFTAPVIEEYQEYSVKLKYLSEDDNIYTYTWTSIDRPALEKTYSLLLNQIKLQDHEYVDKMLEEAMLKTEKENP